MRERLEINFGCYLDDQGRVICHEEKKEEERTKRVAVFGSARTGEDTELYSAIRQMSKDLSQNGWIIVTGGGPGSMAAANQGAKDACVNGEICSLAETIRLPFEEFVNEHVQDRTHHDDFFTRLEKFSRECDAFIVTPGGVGTLLELSLVYQLLQVEHIQNKPIICVGYMWRELREWIKSTMVKPGFLSMEELEMVHYVDRFAEATVLLKGL